MNYRSKRTLSVLLLTITFLIGVMPPLASARVRQGEARGEGRTPPRLSFIDGEVSFWRPGADDWAPSQLNTPLAPGDVLYAGESANLELQIGARSYIRAGADTQIGLENQEPNFMQFRVTTGHASLDLRRLRDGQTVEIDTPSAAFTIDRSGYYRVDVDEDTTTFIARRGGRASVTPAGGETWGIRDGDQVVLEGTDTPRVRTYAATDPDDWDDWNYDRTDHIVETASSRYIPPDVYGGEDLDRYGTWRNEPEYGSVWVPSSVPGDWAPYSTGHWVFDPYYGWTWVDDSPWGWAPYHYGRWVHVGGYWGWAPGPVVVTPVYAPALVAFFGGGGVSVGVGVPFGWVALSWGEPCIPWWGSSGFVGRPWWGGWGGPRVVNNVVIDNRTIVNVNNINVYRNVNVTNAVVAVDHDRFGRAAVQTVRIKGFDAQKLAPVRGAVPIKPVAESLVAKTGPTIRPPDKANRPVVATRAPRDTSERLRAEGLNPHAKMRPAEPKIVRPERGRGEGRRPPVEQASAPPERKHPPAPRGFERTRERARGGEAPAVGAPRPSEQERGRPPEAAGRRGPDERGVQPPETAGKRAPSGPAPQADLERPHGRPPRAEDAGERATHGRDVQEPSRGGSEPPSQRGALQPPPPPRGGRHREGGPDMPSRGTGGPGVEREQPGRAPRERDIAPAPPGRGRGEEAPESASRPPRGRELEREQPSRAPRERDVAPAPPSHGPRGGEGAPESASRPPRGREVEREQPSRAPRERDVAPAPPSRGPRGGEAPESASRPPRGREVEREQPSRAPRERDMAPAPNRAPRQREVAPAAPSREPRGGQAAAERSRAPRAPEARPQAQRVEPPRPAAQPPPDQGGAPHGRTHEHGGPKQQQP